MSKSTRQAFTCLHRVQITPADLAALRGHCEATEDPVYLPSGDRLPRYTLRGVPGKRVDLALTGVPTALPLVLEIGRKIGSYDGCERLRLTVRPWRSTMPDQRTPKLSDHAGPIPMARMLIDRREAAEPLPLDADAPEDVAIDAAEECGQTVSVAVLWPDGVWSETWPCLKSDLSGYDLPSIVLWHWCRYYQFLAHDDVQPLADAFESIHPAVRRGTLAEANRAASRDLYRLARDLGWRKLTTLDRQRYRLDVQWIRTERLEERRADLGYPSRNGVGRYTLDAASGHKSMHAPPDDTIQTSYGPSVVE